MNEDVPILYFELRDNGLSSVRSSTESINIEVNELTSEAAQVLEHEVPMEVDWKLYPNPNNGAFTILTSEPGLFQFFDSKGKLIYKQELTKGSHNIAMQEVPSGVYIATISLNNVSYCKRVCVVD